MIKTRNYQKIMWIWFVVLSLFFGCAQSETDGEPAESSVPVHVVEKISGKASFPIRAAGMLGQKETVKLSFKTGGLLRTVNVDEGASVPAGKTLARLDLSEINARVAQAQSGYERAKRDYERVKRLYDEKVAALAQLQDAQTALSVAESDLEVAQFNQTHSIITAPAAGKILKRFASAGELVGPGNPVFLFAATDKNWVIRFHVADRDVTALSPGDPAVANFDVYPDIDFTGWVTEIGEIADPYTGMFEIEVALDYMPKYELVAGFIGKVIITPAKKRVYFNFSTERGCGGLREFLLFVCP